MTYLSTAIAARARRGLGAQRNDGESIPPAVLGWNARDPYFEMEPGYAITLDNLFPETGFTALRRGYAEHATGVGSGAVEAVFEYRSGSTTQLIAAGGGSIYNASGGGAATSLGSSFTNDAWQGEIFNGRLILVNGDDAPQSWDGTTLAAAGFTGPTTVSDLIAVTVFKERLFFVEKNSASFWYGAVDAVTGVLSEFPLGSVHPGGGNLQAIGTVSSDAGDGPDDFVVFFMSNGDAIVYAGTDPSSSANFALVGVYQIGPVIGRKPLVKLGPDLLAITSNGFIPIKQYLQRGQSQNSLAISDNISGAVRDAIRDFGANTGWQGIFYPRANWLLFNIPLVEGSQAHQYVMNTITGAWCRFTGIDAASWTLFDDDIYFGGTGGKVYKADTNRSDDGTAINWDAQSAYIYFGGRGIRKQFTLFKPIVSSDGDVNIASGLGVDFTTEVAVSQLSPTVSEGAEWDVGAWDVADWAGGTSLRAEWRTTCALGTAASVRISGQTNGQEIRWFATDVLYQRAGFL